MKTRKKRVEFPLGQIAAANSIVENHILSTNNPHSVTASQLGLGSVVNTGDSDTPVPGGTTKFTTGGAYKEFAKKLDKEPIANKPLIESATDKINTEYIPDYILGQMLRAGTITSLNGDSATVALTDNGKAKLGIDRSSIDLVNVEEPSDAEYTGWKANQSNYYICGETAGAKSGEIIRNTNLNYAKILQQAYGTHYGVEVSKGNKTGIFILNGLCAFEEEGTRKSFAVCNMVDLKPNTTYTMSTGRVTPDGDGDNSVMLTVVGGTLYSTGSAGIVTFTTPSSVAAIQITMRVRKGTTYTNYEIKPMVYEGSFSTLSDLPEYQPYNASFAGQYFEVGDWLIADADGWKKIDNTDAVMAVCGKTGYVQLTIADINGLTDALSGKVSKETYNPDAAKVYAKLTNNSDSFLYATPAGNGGQIILRDENGKALVATPTIDDAGGTIVNRNYVDPLLDGKRGIVPPKQNKVFVYTSEGSAGQTSRELALGGVEGNIPVYGAGAILKAGSPSATNDVVNKQYFDDNSLMMHDFTVIYDNGDLNGRFHFNAFLKRTIGDLTTHPKTSYSEVSENISTFIASRPVLIGGECTYGGKTYNIVSGVLNYGTSGTGAANFFVLELFDVLTWEVTGVAMPFYDNKDAPTLVHFTLTDFLYPQ